MNFVFVSGLQSADIHRLCSKSGMTEVFHAAGVPHPELIRVCDAVQVKELAAKVGYTRSCSSPTWAWAPPTPSWRPLPRPSGSTSYSKTLKSRKRGPLSGFCSTRAASLRASGALHEPCRLPVSPHHRTLQHAVVQGAAHETLAAGRPLLVVPVGGEQQDNGRRVEYLGAGLSLRLLGLNEEGGRQAVTRLRQEPGFRARAEALRQSLEDTDGSSTACALIAQLARQHAPLHLPAGMPRTVTRQGLAPLLKALGEPASGPMARSS
jgi:hypothetical protein